MAEKVSTLILDVDLDCHRCCKKIKKILSKFCEIRSQTFDKKQKKVTISGPFDPEKLAQKLRCKAGECIQKIEIKEEKPKPDPPKKVDPPKKAEEKPKEDPPKKAEEKPKEDPPKKAEEKPKEDPPKKAEEKPKEEKPKPKEEPTKPVEPVVPHAEPFRPCYPLYPPYDPAYPPYQPYVPVPVPVVPYYDGYPRDGFCCKGCAEGNPRDMICRNGGGARVSSCNFFSEEDPATCTIM
ncbi:heavy metal transport/detoxification superfamily protein isoform X2 [Tasmannia lanceolata]|uniref:heavy metal transport/detoxification superfamily protein isoform X1 n=1 Tax=Tasmannia lanceolata TaxID=3420 RepID=UPI0040640485